MSRTFKKKPIVGICSSSEKLDKREFNRSFRTENRTMMDKIISWCCVFLNFRSAELERHNDKNFVTKPAYIVPEREYKGYLNYQKFWQKACLELEKQNKLLRMEKK